MGLTLLLKTHYTKWTFGTLAKRLTSIFGVVVGEQCSFEIFSYLIELCEYFS